MCLAVQAFEQVLESEKENKLIVKREQNKECIPFASGLFALDQENPKVFFVLYHLGGAFASALEESFEYVRL
jgi:hypothetical protein